MKLPNLDRVIIDDEKVANYLLNPTRRYGASKARFFSERGFERENWKMLADALRDHARQNELFGPPRPVSGRAT